MPDMLFPGNVPVGTLTSPIDASGTVSFTVSNWPSSIGGSGRSFVVEVGSTRDNVEKMSISGFAGGAATIDTRGWDSTTAIEHQPGEFVRLRWDATNAQAHNDHLYNTALDQHTQYLNVGRHDITARHGTSSVTHGLIGGLGADDHSQYFNAARLAAFALSSGNFPTGPGVITRAMFAGAAQGLMIGQIVWRVGGLSGAEASYLLLANGASYLQSAWPLLDAQLALNGYPYGSDATHFTVPDLRLRVAIGSFSSNIDSTRAARAEGAHGGSQTHAIATTNLAAHAHGVADAGHNHLPFDTGHAHTGIEAVASGGVDPGWMAFRLDSSSINTQIGGSGTGISFTSPSLVGTGIAGTGISIDTGHAAFAGGATGSQGSGTAFDTQDPYLAIPAYIVAA